MKEELRTLKDMKCYCELCSFEEPHNEDDILIKKNELKAEAVKWAKDFKIDGPVNAIWFIKKFFNLTEEDLKEGGNDED